MSKINERLKKMAGGLKNESRREPLWTGPNGEGPNGGVTYSSLCRFLTCRERFRIQMIEGLRPAEDFSHRLEFGNMWHLCEQCHAAKPGTRSPQWEHALLDYCQQLSRRYPTQAQQIDHWYNVALVTFPVYVDFWSKHPDVVDRRPLLSEQVFDVPYGLPSGRQVRLRGKWDSVDLVGKGKEAGIVLMENKTKGDINESQLQRQLRSGFDLQTGIYLTSLTQDTGVDSLEEVKDRVGFGKTPYEKSRNSVKGVRYNVVRRPCSGGKGTIKRKKPTKSNPQGETKDAYYKRLQGIIKEAPETFFMRWQVLLLPSDLGRFRRECLDPILESLVDWYEFVVSCIPEVNKDNLWKSRDGLHSRFPYGVYNPLLEGNSTDLDAYLESGSTVGLVRAEKLFTELSE